MRIVFVCQPGPIEIKAGLLAASLRHVLGPSVHLIAAIPRPESAWGELRGVIGRAFKELDIETVSIAHPFSVSYPVANKIDALTRLGHGPALFLDSDIVCLSPPTFQEFDGEDCACKPDDNLGFDPGDSGWIDLYKQSNLEPTPRRVLTTLGQSLTFPWFNAGVVYTRDAQTLGECWMECCQAVDDYSRSVHKRNYLDQIALPLTIHKLGWSYRSLTHKWNHPAESRPLPASQALPFFAHYHGPLTLCCTPILRSCIRELTDRYRWLVELFASGDRTWPRLPYTKGEGDTGPDYMLTGLPSSGSRVNAARLSASPHSVVVDAPGSLLQRISIATFDRWTRRTYDMLRMKHLDQLLAEQGDTELPRFLVATRCTLPYLSRIATLRLAMRRPHVMACIRDPLATIQRWQRQYRHLATADVASLTRERAVEPYSVEDLADLRRIEDTADVRIRRALLWRYMARILEENRDWITVLRFENRKSWPQLSELSTDCSHELTMDTDQESELPERTLDRLEGQIIADICGQTAERFGYAL
jgi:hypothetical protein